MWIKAIRRENWNPSSFSYICSKHFVESDYQIRPGADRKLLKHDAVPSVFPAFPKYLQESKRTRRILKRHIVPVSTEYFLHNIKFKLFSYYF